MKIYIIIIIISLWRYRILIKHFINNLEKSKKQTLLRMLLAHLHHFMLIYSSIKIKKTDYAYPTKTCNLIPFSKNKEIECLRCLILCYVAFNV